MKYEKWLKNKELEYLEDTLHFGGMNVIDLAERYGTPVYIINEQLLRKRYKELKSLLDNTYKKNEIHYAVKANSNLSVLSILNSEGASFDCSSVGEIHACFKAGIKPEKIFYTGNMFTNEDFKYAIENNVRINLDSVSQISRLARMYDGLDNKKQTFSVRFNPEFGAGHHPHTITGGRNIKFGILEEQMVEAYSLARELGFETFGTHMHIGSGIIDAQDYQKATEKYLSTITRVSETLGISFDFVDFGGGLGIPYRPDQDPLDLQAYNNIVIDQFKTLVNRGTIGEPTLKIEPGRYIAGEASVLITQINTIKNNGYKLFAGVNAGFNTLVRPTMYGSYHHIVPCVKTNGSNILSYDIVGPICESGDVLGKERGITELKEGDYLAVLDAGAYGFTMSSPYNSRPRPAEILINMGNSYLVRKAESYDDLLELQKIPDYLK
ncbi:MAG: diaminopimelate decarboxylase [Candidatus Lokiarchaeota archaeon]|nr:diaminopimelate decarboxylase [Candidatus Lokiarchaeota archaeon]